MRRVSSKMTFFYKRVFPVFWFGFLILFIAIPLFVGGARNAATPFPFLVVPLIMIVFGFFIIKKLMFDLVDEVWEDGETLLIVPPARFIPFSTSPIIDDLIDRVDAARPK
jgi:hypothetical protein